MQKPINEGIDPLKIFVYALIVLGIIFVGYLFYNNYQAKQLYRECLQLTEKILVSNPNNIHTPYCRF